MASEQVREFVEKLAPAAIAIGEKYGLDPKLILSQSALETGWGESVAGNNYFGVKSHGEPGGQMVATHEEVNGQMVPVTDSFRQYGSVIESMEDYAQFLQENPRYKGVFGQNDLSGQINAVADAGYATDSDYASKLHAISDMIDLSAYQAAELPPLAPPNPAVAAIDRMAPTPLMRPTAKPQGGGMFGGAWNALTGGIGDLRTAALGSLPIGGTPAVMRSARPSAPPAAIMRALSTVPGRTAIGRYIMNQNIAPAPRAVSGHVPGGSHVMAVNKSGSKPMTLMRAAKGRGSEQSRSFDEMFHSGMDMDAYRANRAAIGDRITQQSINDALERGATLYRRA